MSDMQTSYMGMELESPIIVGSSGLTSSVEKIVQCEKAGAGAVVLKSLFEEQVLGNIASLADTTHDSLYETEAYQYVSNYVEQEEVGKYLQLIKKAKEKVSLPVIASINCISSREWVSFAREIEAAGADGLEVNLFIMPTQLRQTSEDIEKLYFEIIWELKEQVSFPIALKVAPYFTSLSHVLVNLSATGIEGLVLFNRFYMPDIDLNNVRLSHTDIYSSPLEYRLPLRWGGLLANKVKCDLALAAGFHDGKAVAKALLVGASAVQVVSTLYLHGISHLSHMREQLGSWMRYHKFSSLADFKGKLSQEELEHPRLYERVQFMKYFT
jgi:dihydroorotate dehydrogenase (fumarate)